jgi:hypothetical protein
MLDQEGTLIPRRAPDEVLERSHINSLFQRDGLNRLSLQRSQESQKIRPEVFALSLVAKKRLVPLTETIEGRPTATQFVVLHASPLSRLKRTWTRPACSPNRPETLEKRLERSILKISRSINGDLSL